MRRQPFPELFGFPTKFFIGEFLVLGLNFVHAMDQRPERLLGCFEPYFFNIN